MSLLVRSDVKWILSFHHCFFFLRKCSVPTYFMHLKNMVSRQSKAELCRRCRFLEVPAVGGATFIGIWTSNCRENSRPHRNHFVPRINYSDLWALVTYGFLSSGVHPIQIYSYWVIPGVMNIQNPSTREAEWGRRIMSFMSAWSTEWESASQN